MEPTQAAGAAHGVSQERRRGDRRKGERRAGDRRSAAAPAPGPADRLRELLEAERRKVRALTAKVDLLERQRAQLLARAGSEPPPPRRRT